MTTHVPDRLVLVLVADKAEELSVLAAETRLDMRVVPVMDASALRARLCQTLEDAQRAFELVTYADWCADAPAGTEPSGAGKASGGAVLGYFPGVPEPLWQLAQAATGLRAVALDLVDPGSRLEGACGQPTSMTLLKPLHTNAADRSHEALDLIADMDMCHLACCPWRTRWMGGFGS